MKNWSVHRTIDPSTEPLTAGNVEEKLVVSSGWDSTTLAFNIESARQILESDTDRSLITQTWTLTLDKWPDGIDIYLPKAPYVSTTSFTYLDTNGSSQNLNVTTDYTIATNRDTPIITPISTGWPNVLDNGTKEVITIVYVTGYGDASSVPGWAKEAMMAKIVHAYEHVDTSMTYDAAMVPNKLFFDYSINQ